MHVVRPENATANLRPLAARIASRLIGLVLDRGVARGSTHLGVLEELEATGLPVDQFGQHHH
ncbi:hypothetical protein [Mycobacterium leprae]|nr:hypothetical protein [Mycobacterium leprae]